MKDNVVIRPVQEADIKALQKLQADNIPDADGPAWTDYDWISHIKDGINFVAESGGHIQGYVAAERLLGDGALLHYLIVDEQYRSGEVSLLLFSYFEESLRDNGIKWYLTYARPKVASFLEKHGAFIGETYTEVLKYV